MDIKDNIVKIKEKFPDSVQLICVTKTRDVDEIKKAYEIGERNFGENKVQELINKYDSLDKDVKWHFIGHLQRNKVKYIVGKVHLIHSLDSIRLLNEIEKRYAEENKIANLLIQINIGDEESKTGLPMQELDRLLHECEKCNNIKVKGIMAIIPKGDEESCHKYFKKMKIIFDELKNKDYKNITMEILSMGMSHDYEIAVCEGSSMVRIGEGIFGKRIYNKKEEK